MKQRIAFIDTSLVDYQSLVAALHPSIKVVRISPMQDGWQQVANALARFSDRHAGRIDGSSIDAIDIFSHGAPGSVMLGSGVLNASTLPAYAATLAEIGRYLVADGDILLYGCDVGAGSAGTELLYQLATITGANIAASTNITGAAAMGGNWLLEASAGFVNTAALQVPAYAGIFALNTVPLVNEFQVNTTTLSEQVNPSITALTDGGYVVSWMALKQDGSGNDIYAQRYNASGAAIGNEVQVNTITLSDQRDPSITGLTDGGYVVSWSSFGQDGSGYGIYAQRYNVSGAAIGGEVLVNTTTLSDQQQPSITGLADGGYVVTWTSSLQDGNDTDIYAQRYNANGSALGAEVRVTTTTSQQYNPSITGLVDGGYVVSWVSFAQDGSGSGIYAQRYDAGGSASGTEVRVYSTTTSQQYNPSAIGLVDGGYVVSWVSFNQDGSGWIYAQDYNASGTAVGGEVQVNTTTLNNPYRPSMTVTGLTDGGYVVSWTTQDGSGLGIYAQRYNASGTAIGGEVLVNTTTLSDQQQPSITGLADGGYVVSWMSFNQDGSGNGIFSQRFDAGGNRVAMALQGDAGDNNLVWTGSGAVILDGDAGNDILTGGAGDDVLTGGAGNDRLNGRSGNDTAFYSGSSAGYTFSQLGNSLLITDTNFVDGNDGVDTLTGVESLSFTDGTIQSIKLGEVQVNTATMIAQFEPSITGLTDGGYVVSWWSYGQDGSDHGIYAQRYNASGANIGGEVRVNTTIANSQVSPSVTGLSDGGYVLSWTSFGQDGSGNGIYAQRYNASGTAVDGEVQVNTTTFNEQVNPSITALTDGGYVVSWMSLEQDGNSWGIYARRYTASGIALGAEVQVNSTTLNTQLQPSITALTDGGYVVSWMSLEQDGSGWGIYAQRYEVSGTAVGGEVQVNTTTLSEQQQPSITGLTDGGYVVSWWSQDGNDTDIYAQRYSASGTAVGGEVQVNTTTLNYQMNPSITGLTDGGYVVSWISLEQDGSSWGVYAQRYNANGTAVGGEVQVNTTTLGYQFEPSITGLSDGGYVVSWTSEDGNDYDIYAQRYDAAGNVLDFKLQGDAGNNTLTWTGSGNVILAGDSGNDVLQGGDGNDTLSDVDSTGLVASNSLSAGAGDDTIHVLQSNASSVTTVSGGSGRDSYLLQPNSIGQLLVSDFAAGVSGDILSINSLLINSSGYSGGNPFDATLGYLRLLQQGADTLLQWDRDGAATATNSWQTIITLQNTNAAALTVENFAPATGITSIEIVQTNTAPVAVDNILAATEDTTVIYTAAELLGNDTDINNDIPSISAVNSGIGGTAVLNTDGSVSFTPDANFNGAASFSYIASDGRASSNSANVTVNVAPVNDAPNFTALGENSAFAPTTLNFDAFPDGTFLTTQYLSTGLTISGVRIIDAALAGYPWPAISGQNVASSTAAGVTMTFTLDPAITGNIRTVSTYISTVVHVGMFAYDAAGVLIGQSFITSGNNNVLLSFTSPGNPIARVDIQGRAGHFTIDSLTFEESGLPVFVENGNAVVLDNNVLLSDVELNASSYNGASLNLMREGGANSQDIFSALTGGTLAALTAGNDLVVAGVSIGTVTSNSGGSLLLSFNGNATQSLVNSAVQQIAYQNSAINSQANISINWTFDDGSGQSNATVTGQSTIIVFPDNNAPITTPVSLTAINEDSGVRLITHAELLANASDIDGDSLTAYGLTIATGNGSLIDDGNGSWRYTPAPNDDSEVSFSYNVSDNTLTSVGSATLDLIPVNEAPTFNTAGDSARFTFDQLPDGTILTTQYQSAGLTISGVIVLDAALLGSPWPAHSGQNVAFPTAGIMTFTLDTAITGNIQTVSTYISTAVPVGMFAYDAAGVLVGQASVLPGGAPNFLLSVSSLGNPIARVVIHDNGGNFSIDSLTLEASGLPVFVENGNAVVLDNNVLLSDVELNASSYNGASLNLMREGGANSQDIFSALTGGNLAALTAGSDLVVAGVSIGTITNNSGGSLLLSFNGNATQSLVNSAVQQIAYQNSADNPPANISIDWSFNDGSGASNAIVTGQTTVSITAVNDAPTGTATATLIAGTEDTAYTINASDLLQGFTDVDGDTLSVSGLTADHGTLTDNNNGSFTFNPDANYNGSVSLTYNVIDGNGGTVAASQTVSLAAVNDAPVALDNTLTATEDTTVIYTAADLLGNDTDIENDTLSIATVTSSAGGTAVLNADGSVSFTPGANFNGAASFSYTASDGSASSNSASVAVNIAPVNDAPILNSPLADRAFMRGNAFVFAIPTGSFTEVDGDSLTYTAILADGNPLPSWLQFNAATATFSGNPAIPDVGDLNVRITVSDPGGLSIADVFVLSITTAPTDLVGTANADSLTGTNGSDIIYGLAGNDQLNGGAGSDQLVGGAGNDQLNGGAGIDTMYGGLGDDTYVVNVAGDVIIENVSGGRDTVRSSISYTLGANLEDLILTGTANNNGTGNALDNVLTGNSGDNTLAGDTGNDQLFGQGGDDTLNGGLGDDLLNGGTGRDALIGGLGNDIYVIDDTGDTANELNGQGMDTVQSFLGTYTLTANIENLVLLGAATTGNGNGLNNVITGNSLNNVLRGGAGNDQLFGLGGNDTLTGGTGNDQFVFSTTPAAGNVDRVTDFIAGQDQLVLDALVFTGLNLHNQALDAAMFRSGAGITTAADADDHVIFNTTNGALYYDSDGAGGAAAVQFATIVGVSTLDPASIWIMN